jgi:hypothetical protein
MGKSHIIEKWEDQNEEVMLDDEDLMSGFSAQKHEDNLDSGPLLSDMF